MYNQHTAEILPNTTPILNILIQMKNDNNDTYFTMVQMGHKKLTTTQKYLHLLENSGDEEFTCKVASNLKEATQLIENGFQYVTEIEGLKLFKKRK